MDITTFQKARNLKSEIDHLESAIRALEEICEQGEMPYHLELRFDYWAPVVIRGPRNGTQTESIPCSDDLMNFFKATLEDYRKRLKKAKKELADL